MDFMAVSQVLGGMGAILKSDKKIPGALPPAVKLMIRSITFPFQVLLKA
jgi:hypothetical protein